MGERMGFSGVRSPTMRDVAEAAGAPLSAVSLVLNGKSGVSDARRRQILEAVESLQYQPRLRSKGTTSERRPTIGLVMEALSPIAAQDGFMAEVVAGVETGLRDLGMRMALHLYRPGDHPLHELETMTGRSVDGIVLANGGDIDNAVVSRVLGSKVPTVLLENYLESSELTHAVVADNFTAGYRCTKHLLDLGHRRIGMLVGSTRYISLSDRRRGYQLALIEAGLSPTTELMPEQEHGDAVKGYRQMISLLDLDDPPTAVYAVSDKSAIGAYQALVERGLRIPDDVSVVGTDGVQQGALLQPQLTTFHIPTFELGQTAAHSIAQVVGRRRVAPTRTIVLGDFVERASTRPPR